MGNSLEDRPRDTPTSYFKTVPLGWTPDTGAVDDPLVITIADAADELDPEIATEA